jgi:hypothetical protein
MKNYTKPLLEIVILNCEKDVLAVSNYTDYGNDPWAQPL